jgi:hypothetical protein
LDGNIQAAELASIQQAHELVSEQRQVDRVDVGQVECVIGVDFEDALQQVTEVNAQVKAIAAGIIAHQLELQRIEQPSWI